MASNPATCGTVSRRGFVAAGLGPLIVPRHVLGGAGFQAPSNKITIGFIGTGEHGVGTNIGGFLKPVNAIDAQLVAVCDVDSDHLANAKGRIEKAYAAETASGTFKGVATYGDFRELIARKDIDAVCISTPDHWHIICAIMAARAGKDVFSEKPLTLTLEEGRTIRDVIGQTKRVFQTGSEQRARPQFHQMCELIRNGRIGKLKHIDVGLPGGQSIRKPTWDPRPAMEFCEPPKNLDYDFWLGQAPKTSYFPGRVHWNFRWILDYSGGQFTDYAHHLIDIAQWAHGTEDTLPIEVEGTGTFPKEGLYNTATAFNCNYLFADGVTMTVSSSDASHRFEGSDGWIANKGWGTLSASNPEILKSEIGPNEIHLYRPVSEHRDFLDCVRSRKKCYAHEGVGSRAVAFAHMGNVAMLLGRKLKFDPKTDRFADADANKMPMASRPQREPWTLARALKS